MKTILRTVTGYRRKRRARRTQKGGIIGNLVRGLMGMRKRKRRTGMRKRRVMRGGFLKNILSGINKVARSVPIVSTALRATGNPMAGSVASALGYRRHRKRRMGGFKRVGAVQFGSFRRRGMVKFGSGRRRYGVGLRMAPKRRLIQPRRIGMRRRRTQRGHGLMDVLRKVHDFAKSNKLVSKGLSLIPHRYAQAAAPIASSLGYRRRRTRRMMGSRYLPGVNYF